MSQAEMFFIKNIQVYDDFYVILLVFYFVLTQYGVFIKEVKLYMKIILLVYVKSNGVLINF